MNWPIGITPLPKIMIFTVASMSFCFTTANAQRTDNLAAIPAMSSATLDLRALEHTDTIQLATIPSNLSYFEIFGNAGWFSFNYERMVLDHFGVRLGWGAMPVTERDSVNKGTTPSVSVLPSLLTYYLTVSTYWYTELEAGIVTLLGSNSKGEWIGKSNSILPTSCVGIRYIPTDKGFTFGGTVVQFYPSKPFALKWFFGLSGGYAF